MNKWVMDAQRKTMLVLGVFFALTSSLLAATFLPTNESELRRAAGSITTQPASTIVLDRKITLSSPLRIDGDSITLVGITSAAEIEFSNATTCSKWTAAPTNGIEFTSPYLTIRGIKFSLFEWQGSVVKWNCDATRGRLLTISKCTFNGCSRLSCAPTTMPVLDASDTYYGHCVGAHLFEVATVIIDGCIFNRCCLSQWDYSHCLYISAKNIIVTDNTFSNCGSTLSLGAKGLNSNVFVSGNTFTDGTTWMATNKFGTKLPSQLGVLGFNDNTVFVLNTLSGPFTTPWTGYPKNSNNTIGWNNNTAGVFTDPFACDLWNAKYMTLAEWKTAIESTSTWPITP